LGQPNRGVGACGAATDPFRLFYSPAGGRPTMTPPGTGIVGAPFWWGPCSRGGASGGTSPATPCAAMAVIQDRSKLTRASAPRTAGVSNPLLRTGRAKTPSGPHLDNPRVGPSRRTHVAALGTVPARSERGSRSFPQERAVGPRPRRQRLTLPRRSNGNKDFPRQNIATTCPVAAGSTAQDAPPPFSPRHPPAGHTADVRRRLSGPAVGADNLTRKHWRGTSGRPAPRSKRTTAAGRRLPPAGR
jgi:hypothetical protein